MWVLGFSLFIFLPCYLRHDIGFHFEQVFIKLLEFVFYDLNGTFI